MKWTILAIVVVAAAVFAAFRVSRGFIDTKQDVAVAAIRTYLSPAIGRFHHEVGRYPTSDEGFASLIHRPADAGNGWHGPYLESTGVPIDPWGRPYHYCAPARRSSGPFDVWSTGPDGVDSDDDIGNWQK